MITKKIIILFSIICLLFSNPGMAQDIHFSQAYTSPLTLNPSATGNFKGQYRLICNYKDQWRSISNTYKTIFASADFVLLKKKKKGSYLGAGLVFYNDKAGKSKMGTTMAGFSLAYTVKLNETNSFSAGLQSGFGQKSVNTSGLKWDNQFDGSDYDPALSAGELNYNAQVGFVDFAAGLLWNYVPDEKNRITAGVSMFHVNKPNQSFSKEHKVPLSQRITIHADAQLKLGEKNIYVVPVALYTIQGKLNEINAGGMIKYASGQDSKYTGLNKTSSISVGALYRFKDAVAVLLSVDYKSTFVFGVSYDINLSALTNASKGKGGLELTLIYSGFFTGKQK
jgi:type IX secretion system PorP/SprF family membrane protein